MGDAIFDLINIQFLAIGFLGGLVHSFRLEKVTPWKVLGNIVAGGVAANFCTILLYGDAASNFISPQLLKIIPPWFVAFGVGMNGKHFCYLIEKAFSSWNPLGKTRNE